MIATGSWDKSVIIWDLKSGNILKKLEFNTKFVSSIAFSYDSQYLIIGSGDNTVIIYNIKSENIMKKLEGQYPITSVAFS